MSPMEETLSGLIEVYKNGPRTKERREHFMRVVEQVLDYFVPVRNW